MLHEVLKELVATKLQEAVKQEGFPLARVGEFENAAILVSGMADLLTHSYRAWTPESFLALLTAIEVTVDKSQNTQPQSINSFMLDVMSDAGFVMDDSDPLTQAEALGLASEIARLAWLVRQSLPELTRMADGRFMKIDARSELLRPVHHEEAGQILAARSVYEAIHQDFLRYTRIVGLRLLPATTPPTPLEEIQPPTPR